MHLWRHSPSAFMFFHGKYILTVILITTQPPGEIIFACSHATSPSPMARCSGPGGGCEWSLHHRCRRFPPSDPQIRGGSSGSRAGTKHLTPKPHLAKYIAHTASVTGKILDLHV